MRKRFSGILVTLYIVPDCKHELRQTPIPLMCKVDSCGHWLDHLGSQWLFWDEVFNYEYHKGYFKMYFIFGVQTLKKIYIAIVTHFKGINAGLKSVNF